LRRGLALELEQVTREYINYLLQREVKSVAWLHELKRSQMVVDNSRARN